MSDLTIVFSFFIPVHDINLSPFLFFQCMSCGPREQGQCVGPNICCGPDIGCHINTAVSKACNEENNILTPCEIRGAICGENGSRCVADGICCNSGMVA